jgi:hypothetical protein
VYVSRTCNSLCLSKIRWITFFLQSLIIDAISCHRKNLISAERRGGLAVLSRDNRVEQGQPVWGILQYLAPRIQTKHMNMN